MGANNLVIAIGLHDGRYHGAGEEAPSPARCFQALVAAASQRGRVDDTARSALEWLESREPPIVCLPAMTAGQAIKSFVPNNDLDAVDGDPRRIEKIRTSKVIEPQLFAKEVPFLFAWDAGSTPADADHASVVGRIAERLYQFGRGVDMAWARARLLDDEALESLLTRFPGAILRATPGAGGSGSGGTVLPCPERGSLSSLEARHQAFRRRFRSEGKVETFAQPPKPRFAQVSYGSPPSRRLYELQDDSGRLRAQSHSRVVALVEAVRDAAADRLRAAVPARTADVERGLVGRAPEGAPAIPPSARARILPLASIGHEHADHGIRRVLLETPPDCPLRAADLEWALSALPVAGAFLTPSADVSMLRHYGLSGDPARTWRTVTPAVLPESVKRRRIEPSRARTPDEAKSGSERAAEEHAAVDAVRQALRHAGLREPAVRIRAQREPFEAKGLRAEAFAAGTRFAKERLWHVEVTFAEPLAGPLVIGDGRFLGLGLLRPVRDIRGAGELFGVHAFEIERGLDVETPDPVGLARAFRRAVMARVQAVLGPRAELAPYFTGHDGIRRDRDGRRGGEPARSEVSPHLAFLFDPPRRRLVVIAPHLFEHREPGRDELDHLRTLGEALLEFRELRAGDAGLLRLSAEHIDALSDPVFAASRSWCTLTEFQGTRRVKHATAAEALTEDIRLECSRRGLPHPVVTVESVRGERDLGVFGRASIVFATAISGPVILGRSRFVGGGLFAHAEDESLASWRDRLER